MPIHMSMHMSVHMSMHMSMGMSRTSRRQVDHSFCLAKNNPPSTTQDCDLQPCQKYDWGFGEWGKCTVSCGVGLRAKPVVCQVQAMPRPYKPCRVCLYRHAYGHAYDSGYRLVYRQEHRHAYRYACIHPKRHVYAHVYGHVHGHVSRHAYRHVDRDVHRHA